jgi:hypothetical protein
MLKNKSGKQSHSQYFQKIPKNKLNKGGESATMKPIKY